MNYWSKKADEQEKEWVDKAFDAAEQSRRLEKIIMAKQAQYDAMMAQNANYGYNDPFNNMFGGLGGSQAYGNTPKAPQEVKPAITGQLMWKGAPLPAEWRGAQYDICTRTLTGTKYPHWVLEFESKWTTDRIYVYLDAEKITGEEALRLSETFLEVINQRRLG